MVSVGSLGTLREVISREWTRGKVVLVKDGAGEVVTCFIA